MLGEALETRQRFVVRAPQVLFCTARLTCPETSAPKRRLWRPFSGQEKG